MIVDILHQPFVAQARSFSVLVLSDPKVKTLPSDTVSVMAPAVQKPGAWGKRQTGDASAGSIARLKDWGWMVWLQLIQMIG